MSNTFTPLGDFAQLSVAPVEVRGPGQPAAAVTSGISGWTLLDGDTGEALASFSTGATIDMQQLGARRLNIRANTAGSSIAKVAFSFDGQRDFEVANEGPFTLFSGSPWIASSGSHVIVGTPILNDGSRGSSVGVYFMVANAPIIQPPTVGISAGPINFGEVEVGKSQGRPLVISNTGSTGTITITALHFEGENSASFSSDVSAAISLLPGESRTVQLKFAPSEEGAVAATLTIESTAANGAQHVDLVGVGHKPAAPEDVPTVAPTITWTTGTSVPVGLAESGSIQIGNKLYVFGGYATGLIGQYTNRVLNLDTNVWTTLAPMKNNTPITHFGAATDGKFIYAVAGQAGNGGSTDIRTESWKYNIATNSWSSFTALPEPRGGSGMALVNGELHFFSGFIDDRITHSTKHWAIKIDSNGNPTTGWVEKAPVPLDADHFGIAQVNGIIYLIGGEDSHSEEYSQHRTMQAYNLVTNTWEQKALMPVGTSHFEGGVQVINGRIVVLGGMADDQKIINYGRVYNPANNTWSSITGIPFGRKGGVSAWYKGKLYYATGNGYNGTTSKAYQTNGWFGTINDLWPAV